MLIELKQSKLNLSPNSYCSVFCITMDQADCPRLKWIFIISFFKSSLLRNILKKLNFSFGEGRGMIHRKISYRAGKRRAQMVFEVC